MQQTQDINAQNIIRHQQYDGMVFIEYKMYPSPKKAQSRSNFCRITDTLTLYVACLRQQWRNSKSIIFQKLLKVYFPNSYWRNIYTYTYLIMERWQFLRTYTVISGQIWSYITVVANKRCDANYLTLEFRVT